MKNQNENSMSKNIFANFIGRVFSMVSIYLFIPLYIKFLGNEAYGLVTFFATLQSVMGLLGLGLSKTLRREFASGDESESTREHKYRMMRSVELIYILIGIVIILICFFSANYIANEWLNIGSLDSEIVEATIKLMGISIALQVLTNLYSGCLMGMEFQVLSNSLQVIWSLSKNLGVVLLLWLVSPNLILFYSWYIITDFVYLLVLRIKVVNLLSLKYKVWKVKDLANLSTIWRFASGLLIISFVYVLNTQLDKTIISKYLSLTELGAYNISYSLGNMTSIIASAVAAAAFSRFTQYYSIGLGDKLKENFLSVNKSVSLSVVVLGSYLSVFSINIIRVWTGSTEIANLVDRSAFFVILGTTLLSLQQIPYEFLLSRGNTRVNNVMSILNIPYLLIVTPFLIRNYGILGASVSWFFQQLISTFFYVFYVYKKYITDNVFLLLTRQTYIPFFLSLSISWLVKKSISSIVSNEMVTVILAMICGGVTLILIYFIFDRVFFYKVKEKIGEYIR